MASLKEIPALGALLAPTRAAAHRRRRLRKIGAALCTGFAAFVIFGSMHPAAKTAPSAAASHVSLTGLHLISIDVDSGTVSAATPGTHVDLWSPSGTAIAQNLPVAKGSSGRGALTGNSSGTLLVGLTDTQMRAYAQARGRNTNESNAILVTLSPK